MSPYTSQSPPSSGTGSPPVTTAPAVRDLSNGAWAAIIISIVVVVVIIIVIIVVFSVRCRRRCLRRQYHRLGDDEIRMSDLLNRDTEY